MVPVLPLVALGFFLLGVGAALYAWKGPQPGGWDNLAAAILRMLVAAVGAIGAVVTGLLAWDTSSPWIWVVAPVVVISAVPALVLGWFYFRLWLNLK